MPDGSNTVPTRQKDDELFRTTDPVTAPAEFASSTRRVSGYGGVRFLIHSNVTFRLRIEQAGPLSDVQIKAGVKEPPTDAWVETNRVNSVLNDAGTRQIICVNIAVCSEFMRIFLENTSGGPMAELDLSGLGHPIGEGTSPTGGGGLATAVNLQDCATATEASIKADGAAIALGPCDGGLLIAGRDDSGPFQRHIRVTADGELIVVSGAGTTLTTNADTAVGVGATVALPVPPAGTRRQTVQVTGGNAATRMRVREVGGPAGGGTLLLQFGSRSFDVTDPLEVQNVAGPANTVMIQFEN